MKKPYPFLYVIFIAAHIFFLFSCDDKNISVPFQNNSDAVNYIDSNIDIQNFKVSESEDTITISFNIIYTNDVSKIEVLSGSSENQLCAVSQIDLIGDISSEKTFVITGSANKRFLKYYMIRFFINDGNWDYTPVCCSTP